MHFSGRNLSNPPLKASRPNIIIASCGKEFHGLNDMLSKDIFIWLFSLSRHSILVDVFSGRLKILADLAVTSSYVILTRKHMKIPSYNSRLFLCWQGWSITPCCCPVKLPWHYHCFISIPNHLHISSEIDSSLSITLWRLSIWRSLVGNHSHRDWWKIHSVCYSVLSLSPDHHPLYCYCALSQEFWAGPLGKI